MSNRLNSTEKKYLEALTDLTGVWQYPLTVFYKVWGEIDSSQYSRTGVIREAYETLRGLRRLGLVEQRVLIVESGGDHREYIHYRITDAGRVAITHGI